MFLSKITLIVRLLTQLFLKTRGSIHDALKNNGNLIKLESFQKILENNPYI